MRSRILTLLLSILVGCGGTTGQPAARYPVYGQGEVPVPFSVGAWTVTLTKAQLAFGPAYFCATAAASSDLCPVALSELNDTAVIDGLDVSNQPLGEGHGQSGTVRSASYDLGIDWFTTQRQPSPSSVSPGGHSATLEGQAVKGTQTVQFTAALDATPEFQDTRVVQGQPLNVAIEDGLELTVGLLPSEWLKGVDFDALAASAPIGMDPVVIATGSPAYEALLFGMVTGRPATLNWRNAQ